MLHGLGMATGEGPEEEQVGGKDGREEQGDVVDGAVQQRLGEAARVAQERRDVNADEVEVVQVEAKEPYSCEPTV